MTGCRVAQNSPFQINEEIRRSDEMLFEFATKRAVESRENERGIMSMCGLRGKSDFEHGSDERGGNAVHGNIGDENSKALVIYGQEIVKVSRDGAHRDITGCDFKTSLRRNRFREN